MSLIGVRGKCSHCGRKDPFELRAGGAVELESTSPQPIDRQAERVADFVKAQEPLGDECSKVLHDNLNELLETSAQPQADKDDLVQDMPVSNTLAGFRGGFIGVNRRAPTEQEIWNAAVRSGIDRTSLQPANTEPSKEAEESTVAWSALQAILDHPVTLGNDEAAQLKLIAVDAFTHKQDKGN